MRQHHSQALILVLLCLVGLTAAPTLADGPSKDAASDEAAPLHGARPLTPLPAWLRETLDAMRIVETGGESRPSEAEGDGGRSIGPYQISRAYWLDSGVEGEYEQVRSRQYAERVILAYWKRYARKALAGGDIEVLVRIHNGGPKGHRKSATRAYWRKVQREIS